MSANQAAVTQTSRKTSAERDLRDSGIARTSPSSANRLISTGDTTRSSARKRRRRRRRLVLLVLFLALISAAVAGWWYMRRNDGAVETAAVTTTVQRRDFASSVLATGAVQPQVGAEVRVGARISGKVAELRANIGDRVTKGQVIAELEKADLEAVVAQCEAELQLVEAKLAAVKKLLPKEIRKAELEVMRWQATCSLGEKEIGRESRLLEADATSEQVYEQAQERLAVAKRSWLWPKRPTSWPRQATRRSSSRPWWRWIGLAPH